MSDQRLTQDDNHPTDEPKKVQSQEPETEPAQERGERLSTGKIIARGGKDTGKVAGATEEKK